MKEIWKDIPNYENIYQSSNLGRIRTVSNKVTYTQKHGIRVWKQRILKGRGNNKVTGYRVGLWKNGICKDWLVARLIVITFIGYPTEKANTVNHKDGNRFNNNIFNLEWLSRGDNVRHAFNTGLMPYKKIKLYNKSGVKNFRSMSLASEFIGRNKGYISGCLKLNKKIISKLGEIFHAEVC